MRRRPLQLYYKCIAVCVGCIICCDNGTYLWHIKPLGYYRMCCGIVHCYITSIKFNVECDAQTIFVFRFLMVCGRQNDKNAKILPWVVHRLIFVRTLLQRTIQLANNFNFYITTLVHCMLYKSPCIIYE